MANITAPSQGEKPVFPEDIERAIIQVLLDDARDMCGTMSLVASRFYGWTKPIMFRTVVVRRHNDWTKRIDDLLLPNASFIRCLAIPGQLSGAELSHVRRLLESARQVLHFAVTWSLWAQLQRECGALGLESLYLIWDGASHVPFPSLKHLQRPSALRDLTIFAPADLHNLTSFRTWGELYLPDTAHCTSLAYVTYAADRYTNPTVGSLCEDIPSLQGAMFVLVNIPEEIVNGGEDEMITDDVAVYSRFSTAYLPRASQVVGEWVAKMEGRPSVLVHPPPHAVESLNVE
ncbi:hypothetical protein B0H16DRAFT_830961 [Mycena metata]|uniref:Uncharacterized protein n=1 Tax=Mycena metata TaxID=1033252 RepID=A0AAD7IVN3_9AGAR|nr:hypothetical protein B0H16DRAFT_830961 [Mycena metata]